MSGEAEEFSQVADFKEECDVLAALIEALPEDRYEAATQFKGWTVNDVLVHFHYWNRAAHLSATDPEAFKALLGELLPALSKGGLRRAENAAISERGLALFALWRAYADEMAAAWAGFDPKRRVAWVGPEMSLRSAITARQMETWAHGQELFDLAGVERRESDRVRNIVRLGLNTFGWSFQVNGETPPAEPPLLRLTAPSGAVWTFGKEGTEDRIEGSAVEFAQVVTQTRNVADTALRVTGAVATRWMAIAQCFAGPPETPPAPGARFKTPSAA
ncbi:MAG: TIGR03084 family metal-binding protein [Pseudomonadota bacterium]